MNQETHDEDPYAPIQHILRNQGGEWITLYTHAEDENGLSIRRGQRYEQEKANQLIQGNLSLTDSTYMSVVLSHQ